MVYSTLSLYLSVLPDESLALGRDLEIHLEVRLVLDSGLLLHTGAKKTQQLSLYLNQGKVTQSCTHTYTCSLPITPTRLNHFQMSDNGLFRVGGPPVWSVRLSCAGDCVGEQQQWRVFSQSRTRRVFVWWRLAHYCKWVLKNKKTIKLHLTLVICLKKKVWVRHSTTQKR